MAIILANQAGPNAANPNAANADVANADAANADAANADAANTNADAANADAANKVEQTVATLMPPPPACGHSGNTRPPENCATCGGTGMHQLCKTCPEDYYLQVHYPASTKSINDRQPTSTHTGYCLKAEDRSLVKDAAACDPKCVDKTNDSPAAPGDLSVVCTRVCQLDSTVKMMKTDSGELTKFNKDDFSSVKLVDCDENTNFDKDACKACKDKADPSACRARECSLQHCTVKKQVKCRAITPGGDGTGAIADAMRSECSNVKRACGLVTMNF